MSSSKQRRRERRFREVPAVHPAAVSPCGENGKVTASTWPGEHLRYLTIIGIALIALATLLIYAQTVRVPTIDYEDSHYLLDNPYVNVNAPFSRLGAVWNEPYFGLFHPVTTTTWLLDRAWADKHQPFDALPFRIAHLLYAVLSAALLIPLYRRLGLPTILALLGGLIYAVHPIHTEVVAWLSERKDLTSEIFIVLAFFAWLWARTASTPGQWRIRHAVTILLTLLAVLSKPVAVILPPLFAAYEFCCAPHPGITQWRWAERQRNPVLTRILALAALFLPIGVICTAVFRSLLARDLLHGGWLIGVPLLLTPLALAKAPSAENLAAFRGGSSVGTRVVGPPFMVLSVVFGAGSAWTYWAQTQVGAIKGGLPLLPTLNLTCDALLRYAAKTLVPIGMSPSYTWNEYPYISVKGLLGAALVLALVWAGMRLAGSANRYRRLAAFGIFWYLIAFIPVSNLVPTANKMADRYLFVPTIGAVLAVLALAAAGFPDARRQQTSVCGALVLVAALYTGASYARTEVWCGKTTLWKGRPHPDLSLWTRAVETNPENIFALNSLALVYLRFNPPETGQALALLNRALEIGAAHQALIAGGRELDLSPIYQNLGNAYLAQASGLAVTDPKSEAAKQKKESLAQAANYFELASHNLSGFPSGDAQLFSWLADAYEGQAQIDAQELAVALPDRRPALFANRDALRRKSEQSIGRARDILAGGHVAPTDSAFRAVMIEQGNLIFEREVGASPEEKAADYRQALARYQEAAALFPDDPRPYLYQGICYERLTGMAPPGEEKQTDLALAEAALRKAATLQVASPDYSAALPYRGLASLYAHVNDYHAALEALKKAKQADPDAPGSAQLDREIQSVEQYLAAQGNSR